MQIVCNGENLQEISILFFLEKLKKINISSAENATQYIKHWNNYLSVSKLLIYNTNVFVCLLFFF